METHEHNGSPRPRLAITEVEPCGDGWSWKETVRTECRWHADCISVDSCDYSTNHAGQGLWIGAGVGRQELGTCQYRLYAATQDQARQILYSRLFRAEEAR